MILRCLLMMRIAGMVVIFLTSFCGLVSQANAQCNVPEECVRRIYAGYLKDGRGLPKDVRKLFDKDVEKLWSKTKEHEYDFFIQGQDWQLSRFKMAPTEIKSDKARVKVEFFNFDTRKRLDYYFIKSGDGWLITEIKGPGRESLRTYLKN